MNEEVDVQPVTSPIGAGWMTPAQRRRPATIHEGFSFYGEEYGVHSWDTESNFSFQQTPSEGVLSRPISVHQDFYPPGTPLEHCNSGWPKPEETFEFPPLPDMGVGQYSGEEAIPVMDLQYHHGQTDQFGGLMDPRRLSGSSFTVSTSGALSDMNSYEDLSGSMSELPYGSDYPPTSNRNSLMSSTPLSPVASPRLPPQGRPDLVRTSSRGRASPSPRPGVRSAPYTIEPRNKRWSTGSYGTANRRAAPFVYQPGHDYTSLPPQPPLLMTTGGPENYRNSMLLPSQLPSHMPHQFAAPLHPLQPFQAPSMSHGLFRMLQSNGDAHTLHGHYADHADPPDLYAALHEEQTPPPPEDMNPSDPDMMPREQELRFEGDLYTPRWVRGHGNKREGWCGICKPGRWLVLKNSAFWYDKSFSHGISAATGSPFQEPQETRRMDGNPDVWEGLCGSCNDWVALVSSKKKGTTWFRHAYKCHTHPKVRDAPKRRRENSNSRALGASQMTRPKSSSQPALPQTPTTPPLLASASSTPTPGQMGMQFARPPIPTIPRSHPMPPMTPMDDMSRGLL